MDENPQTISDRRGDSLDNAIDVAVPRSAEHAATVRVIASSLCAEAGFSVDEIDDMKLAVSECFTLMLDGQAGIDASRIHVRFLLDGGTLTVTVNRGHSDDQFELDTLAKTILASVVDEYAVAASGITLIKRATESSR